ncbi:MAG: hypothetical protein KAX49_11950 [Halanaerobiales bacterium]|nr:hypothetical protein [Halanaerobiales bacterium]
MKHDKKRISKIIDELIMYCLSMDSTDIDVKLENREDYWKIQIKSNCNNIKEEKINRLIKCLNYPKQEEMEEYYWELTGECDVDTELSIVGMMTNKAEVNFANDILEIVLYRNK